MEMALPIAVGIACGLLGAAPYPVALAVAKKRRDASIAPGAIAVCVSSAVVALSTFVTWWCMRDMLVPFIIALVAVFLLVVVVSALVFVRQPRP